MYCSEDVAIRIKEVAKTNKITIKQLLSEAGLSSNVMTSYRTSMPKADNLAKIADVLNCSVDYLLGRSELMLMPDANLTKAEKEIIAIYRGFNAEGQEKVDSYVRDLNDSDRYKKDNSVGMVEEA